MPFGDWQFWLVTALAAWGGWVLLRPFIRPRKPADGDAACPTCASGSAARTKTARRVSLTVEKRKI